MAEITHIAKYRESKVINQFESAWRHLFHEAYDIKSGMAGIPDKGILYLSQPEDDKVLTIYTLINRTMNGPDTAEFELLDMTRQLQIIDIHLFMADRCRFEMMRRLGWVERYVGLDLTLVDFITRYRDLRDKDMESPPQLAATHSRYQEFRKLINREKSVFVRRLFPAAVLAFGKQVQS